MDDNLGVMWWSLVESWGILWQEFGRRERTLCVGSPKAEMNARALVPAAIAAGESPGLCPMLGRICTGRVCVSPLCSARSLARAVLA